jgi:hypothetical protein
VADSEVYSEAAAAVAADGDVAYEQEVTPGHTGPSEEVSERAS